MSMRGWKLFAGSGAAVIAASLAAAQGGGAGGAQPELGTRTAPVVTAQGLRFKDLNRNGRLDGYEDWRRPAAERAADLAGRLTLAEKAGIMMHGSAPAAGSVIGIGERYDLALTRKLILEDKVAAFITRLAGNPGVLAEENNKLQEIAESGRLGIPVTISSDPRNAIQSIMGASIAAGGFSQWPDNSGMAAAGDPALVRQGADVARQEYLAVGIRQALSPQVDLASEPRWPRASGSFGEDAALASRLGGAYVEGMQHGAAGIDREGVLAVVKHWAGYGAAKDGWDGHNHYGRFSSFEGRDIGTHLIPFEGALEAHVSGVMPTYNILEGATYEGKPIEQVGAGYSRFLLTDLLRGRLGYRGVILSDWLITSDCPQACVEGVKPGEQPILGGMPWGVEGLTQVERFAKAVNAGIDQFGGVADSAILVEAVRRKLVPLARIDASVRRILEQKFAQGLFENPYVDPARAREIVGSAAFRAAGEEAQRRSVVLLKNEGDVLPLRPGTKVYLHNIDPALAAQRGLQPVADPAAADVALVRVAAPAEGEHPGYFFGSRMREGRLFYKESDADYQAIRRASAVAPTVLVVGLDRAAILTNVKDAPRAIVANFGITDGPLLDVLSGRSKPRGKLPFELPSSQAAVEAQRPDLPHDSAAPLYPLGFGLSYP